MGFFTQLVSDSLTGARIAVEKGRLELVDGNGCDGEGCRGGLTGTQITRM